MDSHRPKQYLCSSCSSLDCSCSTLYESGCSGRGEQGERAGLNKIKVFGIEYKENLLVYNQKYRNDEREREREKKTEREGAVQKEYKKERLRLKKREQSRSKRKTDRHRW